MIRINLLSPENIKKEEPKEIIVLAVIIMCIFVLIGLFKYFALLGAYSGLQTDINNAQKNLSKYEDIVKQVETLQATKAVLETKKNVINTLMEKRLVYPKMMEDLLQLLPTNVWFTSLNTTIQPDLSMRLDLQAQSLDVYSIADMITALSASGYFSNVEIGAISTSGDAKKPVSTFTINFNYKRQQP
ncbi:MAG: PilN domain-containing protein [Elusimicrobiota bacterium]